MKEYMPMVLVLGVAGSCAGFLLLYNRLPMSRQKILEGIIAAFVVYFLLPASLIGLLVTSSLFAATFHPFLIGAPLGLVLGLLLASLFLRIAVTMVMNFKLYYAYACVCVFINLAITNVAGFLLGLLFGSFGLHPVMAGIFGLIVGFFVSSLVYGRIIRETPSSPPIGFGNGATVSFLLMLINIGMGFVGYLLIKIGLSLIG